MGKYKTCTYCGEDCSEQEIRLEPLPDDVFCSEKCAKEAYAIYRAIKVLEARFKQEEA